MEQTPKIHGQTPRLIGKNCKRVIAQQYWHAGTLADPFNVLFFCFDSLWHRLALDCGEVFWRSSPVAPVSRECPEINASYRLVDLGFADELITRLSINFIPDGVEVGFEFASGNRLCLRNVNDITSLTA